MLRTVARRQHVAAQPDHDRTLPSCPTAATRRTVLCVDDHAPLLASLKRAFDQHGLNTVVAPDAATAKEILRHRQVDAMIVDLRLPDGSGLALLTAARLRGIEAPAIVYTGYPDTDTASRAQQIGVRYISKHDVRRVRDLIELVRTDIDADVTFRASVAKEASLLDTLAGELETIQSSMPAWRDHTALALVRALVDVSTPLPLFLAAAESLLVLMEDDATSRKTAAFMRVQAQRCLSRSLLARRINLQAIVELMDQAGPSWQKLRAHDPAWPECSDVRADELLHGVGWSLDQVICGVALRRAVMLVAHTQERSAQIGYQLGFEQPPLFGRFFRRLLALAPTEFRDLARRC